MRGSRKLTTAPFVGRDAALEQGQQLLDGKLDVLFVHGELGVGVTRLLAEIAHMAEERHMPVSRLDAQVVRPSPSALQRSLMDLPESSEGDPALLIIDSFESHRALELHYVNVLVPALPEGTRLLIGARQGLCFPWELHNKTVEVTCLDRLSVDETASCLEAAGVPQACYDIVFTRTRGQPLMLCTVAEFFTDERWSREATGDGSYTISDVIALIMSEAPSDEHRVALRAASMPQVLSERLLAAMLDLPSTGECYRWLESRPYMTRIREGLVLHEAYRDAILQELVGNTPELYREFLLRAGRYHIARIEAARDAKRRTATAFTHFYTQRLQPPVSNLYRQLLHSPLYRDHFEPQDAAALDDMLRRFEGAPSAELSAGYRKSQPDGLTVFRDVHGQVDAFMHVLNLGRIGRRELAADPVAAAALRTAQDRAAQPDGRRRRTSRLVRNAALVRFFMARETYQSESPGLCEIIGRILFSVISAPELSLLIVPTAQAASREAQRLLDAGLLMRLSNEDVTMGKQRLTMLGLDLTELPMARWLRNALTLTISGNQPPASEAQVAPRPLNRDEFRTAVADVLTNFSNPGMLRKSPLLFTLSALDAGSARRGVQVVREWIVEGLSRLARMPGGNTYATALRHHYLGEETATPASGRQELRAAEQLLVATLWDALVQRLRHQEQGT